MTDDIRMHPQRARSGGTCIRFDWGEDVCDTIGWHVIPEKGDLVRCNGGEYRVQRRIFDSDEPNCIVIEVESVA